MTRPQDMLRDGPGEAVMNSLSPFLLPSRRCGGTGRGGTLFCAPLLPDTFAVYSAPGIRLKRRRQGSTVSSLNNFCFPVFYHLKALSAALGFCGSQNAANHFIQSFHNPNALPSGTSNCASKGVQEHAEPTQELAEVPQG